MFFCIITFCIFGHTRIHGISQQAEHHTEEGNLLYELVSVGLHISKSSHDMETSHVSGHQPAENKWVVILKGNYFCEQMEVI